MHFAGPANCQSFQIGLRAGSGVDELRKGGGGNNDTVVVNADHARAVERSAVELKCLVENGGRRDVQSAGIGQEDRSAAKLTGV